MANRNQNFAFITDSSRDQRKDLYETPMGLPTKPHNAEWPTYLSVTLLGGFCMWGWSGGTLTGKILGMKKLTLYFPDLTLKKVTSTKWVRKRRESRSDLGRNHFGGKSLLEETREWRRPCPLANASSRWGGRVNSGSLLVECDFT